MKKLILIAIIAVMIYGGSESAQGVANIQSDDSVKNNSAGKKSEDCGCDNKSQPDVLATVNGEKITDRDLEVSLTDANQSVEEQIYELRHNQLQMKIRENLFIQEARKKNITVKGLLELEVAKRIKTVSEDTARRFYEDNRARIGGDFEKLKSKIIDYLQDRERRIAEDAYADELRKEAAIQVFLTRPVSPAHTIAIDDQPLKGNANAKVTIVEFTDFQCPACAMMHRVLENIMSRYGDQVRIVARDYPLDQHRDASKAAEAAEAAREQGKYWEYTAILFRNQSALSPDKLKEYAGQLNLDRKRFDEALDSGKYSDKVQRDLQEGNRLGIKATPSIFINGRLFRGSTIDSLKAEIDNAISNSTKP